VQSSPSRCFLIRILLLLIFSFVVSPSISAATPDYYCPELPLAELVRPISLEPSMELHLQSPLRALCSIHRLQHGAVMFTAKMDIDADGSPNALTIDPEYGQLTTAFRYRGFHGQEAHVDAERVPYIVLPQADTQNEEFYLQSRVGLGDIAAVVYRGRVEFAFVADVGPPDMIGEGSIALAQALGHNPFVVRNGQKLVDRAIPGGVVYIVFPGSRLKGATPDNVLQLLQESGSRLLAEITAESNSNVITSE
jgi:Fungal chitosanase of glycosyl hydrolase group 75